MLQRASRYRHARHFSASAVAAGTVPGTRPRPITPTEGVLEHRIVEGDRLDRLAYHYFRDSRLWWRIVDANPDMLAPGLILPDERIGETLLIPRARE